MEETKTILQTSHRLRYTLIIEGFLVGGCAGIISIVYRQLLAYAEEWVQWLSAMMRQSVMWAAAGFVLLALIALGISLLLRHEPLISGSGIPQIEVTFDIDANGILNVSAKDKGTGKEQKIRIEASSGLTEQEIQRMRDEAKANEAKDKEEKERIDKINAADSNIFATEKQLKEYGDKLPADKKAAIETALGKLKEAHKNADVAAIDTALAELNAAWQAASQDIYAAQQQQGGAQQGAPHADAGAGTNGQQQGGSNQPEDVEFEEVK